MITLAILVVAMTSCSTQSTSNEPDTATTVQNFQAKLNSGTRAASRPNIEELGDILRRNEVFGQLAISSESMDWVGPGICDDFTIPQLLTVNPDSRQKSEIIAQDFIGLKKSDVPDVYYTIKLTSLTGIDTDLLRNNISKLSDIFFRSSDKYCDGTVNVGPDLNRPQGFSSGYFPETSADNFEAHHYVQSGDGSDRFARTVSLMILEPAQSAVAVVVTAFNLRTRNSSPATINDMLDEISQVSKEINDLWKIKIQTDPDWLTIAG